MMEWYQILSCFLTNSIRGFLGLYLVCGLLSARMELRSPDPTANPYLALAAVLLAVLRGQGRFDLGEN